jgi:3-phenylpropionate/cinnamic acid dioxygenase small subunit
MNRAEAEDLLYKEALLLDTLQLETWLGMFTPDGLYWIPIDDSDPIETHVSIVYDTPERRAERVDHLLHDYFPAQSPRSRTVHLVSNVICEESAAGVTSHSNQMIHEMRTGDYRQSGIGEISSLIAQVEHDLQLVGNDLKIKRKKILLMNRDTWQGNLTFLI